MRWTIGLFVFFFTLFAMNGTFIYLAVTGAEPVATSYKAEHR